jgi:hypothetical protein
MGDQIIKLLDDLLKKAMRGVYPIEADALYPLVNERLPSSFASVRELHSTAEEMITELEAKLTAAENALRKQSE